MAHISADRVADTTESTGVGVVTLDNQASPGYRAFSAVMGNGDTCYYTISHQSQDQWEVGQATYTNNTLSRDSIFSSSNSGNAVHFSAGVKDVFITLPASKTPLAPVPVNQGGTGATTASNARTALGLGTAATQSTGTFAQVANNLSDLENAGTARTNLGLGSAATQSTGTFAQVANNLSDLANAATARTNLGLGTLATQSGTFSGTSSGTNTGDQDLSGLVPKTTTVNGAALSGNVTLTTGDIADSTNKRYVTDAQQTVLGNTSGTNTGDQLVFKTIAVSGQSDVVADSATDTLTLAAGNNITLTTDAGTDTVTIAASGGNAFGTIAVSGQSDVVADAAPDTLTLVAGSNITITTNAGTDTITIASTAAGMTAAQTSQLNLALVGG